MRNTPKPTTTVPLVRCAVYTRKSTEEGLEQAFNSLDAQREAGQAYITAQRMEGWTCLPERYDDGGFSGGNMERPALRRLLTDVQEGRVDVVVVYKLDRLSRSLLDFTRLMELFEKHCVALVSITQKLDTSSSMGRLVLNVLMSFAEFERAIIAERTRDKVAATRRKGRWCGGYPILGYDLDSKAGRLLVNDDEATMVRTIFQLYLDHGSLLPVVEELERRGWVGKGWTTNKGKERVGKPFTRTSLHRLLTNVAYLGKTRYKTEVHAGEHKAIVEQEMFEKVQTMLRRNGATGGSPVRNEFGFVLKGLLRCTPCGCAMTPTHTSRKGTRRYRYYLCSRASKHGRKTCPSPSIPAAEIEQFVVGRVRSIGNDPALQAATFDEAIQQDEGRMAELEAERRAAEKDLTRWNTQLASYATKNADDATLTLMADLQERVRDGEQRLTRVKEQMYALRRQRLNADEVAAALSQFGPVWESLTPNEQARLVQLLVERVEYDGGAGKVKLSFHASGIKTLAAELAQLNE